MRWLTVFDDLDSVHLNKDVGLLPKALAEKKELKQVSFLTNKPLSSVDYLKEIEFLFHKKIWLYLIFNSRKYDVLHLFHLKWSSVFRALIFKILNPCGKVYLKLDADFRIKKQVTLKGNALRKPRVSDLLYFLADHISVETKEIYDFLCASNWDKRKLFLLPNGIDRSLFDFADQMEKERVLPRSNKIITVGRLGSYQKNTESLIRAYKMLPDVIRMEWSLDLIGPVDISAIKLLEEMSVIGNDEVGVINFIGDIKSREELFKLYMQSSIFAFPSRWEGASLAILEAFVFQLGIVATPVGMAPELVYDNDNGFLCEIDDDASLSKAIENTISLLACKKLTSKIVLADMCWDVIADKLLCKINEN